MRVAATGHRPNKLGGYSYEVFRQLRHVAMDYLDALQPDTVISGMALGWDMAWADAALRLDIPLIAAIPFEGQQKMWPANSQRDWNKIVEQSSEVVYVCDPGYAAWKMQKRNEWMVDNSDLVVALWDGSPGGTANCVRYAKKKDRDLVNLWEAYVRIKGE